MATTRKKSGAKKSGTNKASKPAGATAAKPSRSTTGSSSGASKPAASRPAASPRAAASKAAAAKAGAAKSGGASAPAAGSAAKKAATAKAATPARAKAEASKVRATRAPKREATAAPASQRVALAVAEAALDKKAVNVEIIDVAGKVDYADYVVVMSGTSDRQVNALARGIAEDVEKKTRNKCLGVEGLPGGAWVLMDFGDVVVHIFHHDVRGYYDLESLWIDAARVPVPATPASPARP